MSDVERFRALIAGSLGLAFDESRTPFLVELLERRARAAGCAPSRYLDRMAMSGPTAAEEMRALAPELTVTETYFFRSGDQLRALDELVFRGAKKSIRILSAGCASGEEPYSLAMLLRSAGATGSIVAVDVNSAMLERAARGRYSLWSLRETPSDVRARWFRAQGNDFVLDREIRELVRFEERSLATSGAGLFGPEAFDVIFCRNVMMYFAPDAARALAANMARSLVPEGLLFLGHAENLRGISHDFRLKHTHGTFYYQRRTAADVDDQEWPLVASSTPAPSISGASWFETIRGASDRVRSLTSRDALEPDEERPPPGAPIWDLRLATELLRQERFSEARSMLGALPPESERDPDVLLLRAVLLTHGGDLREAERACADLLELDDMSAGAHYLMALCREAAGDRTAATEHDRSATHLDPGFAMPRLHLGLLARRAGDSVAAKRELGLALALLCSEDPSRLLLFGGGFDRAALVALCRAELAAPGETP